MVKFFEFLIQTSKREEIIDITDKIEDIIKKSKIKNGLCILFVPHATSALIINENYDPNVCKDILNFLRKQIPKGIWLHDSIDQNADSHIKSSLLGVNGIIPFKESKLMLGTWQGIGFVELDGPRKRRIIICLVGEK